MVLKTIEQLKEYVDENRLKINKDNGKYIVRTENDEVIAVIGKNEYTCNYNYEGLITREVNMRVCEIARFLAYND